MKLKLLSILFLLGCSLPWAYSLQYHPLLLKVSDKKGKTLAKALDEVYGDKIKVKKGWCQFFEKQSRGADLETKSTGATWNIASKPYIPKQIG